MDCSGHRGQRSLHQRPKR